MGQENAVHAHYLTQFHCFSALDLLRLIDGIHYGWRQLFQQSSSLQASLSPSGIGHIDPSDNKQAHHLSIKPKKWLIFQAKHCQIKARSILEVQTAKWNALRIIITVYRMKHQ